MLEIQCMSEAAQLLNTRVHEHAPPGQRHARHRLKRRPERAQPSPIRAWRQLRPRHTARAPPMPPCSGGPCGQHAHMRPARRHASSILQALQACADLSGQSRASTPNARNSCSIRSRFGPSRAARAAVRASARPPPSAAILPQFVTDASAQLARKDTASACTSALPACAPACGTAPATLLILLLA